MYNAEKRGYRHDKAFIVFDDNGPIGMIYRKGSLPSYFPIHERQVSENIKVPLWFIEKIVDDLYDGYKMVISMN